MNIERCRWCWTLHERWGEKPRTLTPGSECFSLHWCVISRLLNENSMLPEPSDLSNMKRHSEGTFSNDYSKYLETRRAQDFVQWLKNSKRNGWACLHVQLRGSCHVLDYYCYSRTFYLSCAWTGTVESEIISRTIYGYGTEAHKSRRHDWPCFRNYGVLGI